MLGARSNQKRFNALIQPAKSSESPRTLSYLEFSPLLGNVVCRIFLFAIPGLSIKFEFLSYDNSSNLKIVWIQSNRFSLYNYTEKILGLDLHLFINIL